MDLSKPQLPEINPEDRTPLVNVLLELLAWQQKQIDALEQEILKLKGETTKPKLKPSKIQHLKIDASIDIQPETIPEGSIFKGYREVIIQDIRFESFNTRYRLAQYQTPAGGYLSGQLPDGFNGCHFGKTLISFILYQYHHQHVTQPLLLKQLQDLGVDISSGRLSQFITEDLAIFHAEKTQLLQAGLSVSQYVHADDTGARHNGQNGYCTHIGNELFAWFGSTESNSRINFLSCLSQGGTPLYVLNAGALAYLEQQKLPRALIDRLEDKTVRIQTEANWQKWLDQHAITKHPHRRILTEGALMGGLMAQGIPVNLAIISDDAGQFNVFDHALCWIHAERLINRLIPLNDAHVNAVDGVREQIWQLYRDLKAYKRAPTIAQAEDITSRFQTLCSTPTVYATLNQALKRKSMAFRSGIISRIDCWAKTKFYPCPM